MPIIGTAGHVDHGKSTLVLALTGIDPDRLVEEKRRGMTIDLGFAHLDLPNAGATGIVDVPGHARFLHNMLAGVHGVDVVLLVVAADEGVRAQTREHLDILQLLGATSVVVALTKVDLVDPDFLALAEADVRAELERRRIAAVVVPVSAPRGEGLAELLAALDRAVAAAPVLDRGMPRLPIDRSFSMVGFGTVVTGTLVDGPLSVGQQVEVVPAPGGRAIRVKLRGLQQHGQPVPLARPGSRVAVNLQGIDHDALHRGQVLVLPGTPPPTRRFDGRVQVLSGGSGLRHNSRVRVHAGSAEVAARVVLLEVPDDAGGDPWAQLRLAAPLALREGDRFILRRLSPSETLAGGQVVDVAAPLHRRGDRRAIEALAARSDNRARVLQEIRRHRGVEAAEVAAALSLELVEVEGIGAALGDAEEVRAVGVQLWDAAAWTALAARVTADLETFHRRYPLRPGMAAEELRERLQLGGRGAADALEALVGSGLLERRPRGVLALRGWQPALNADQRRQAELVLARLSTVPLAPPRGSELAAGADLGDVFQYLEGQGRVVRIGPDLWLLKEAVDGAAATLRTHLQASGSVTVAAARDLLGSSRKVVVPLLEHFDRCHLTVRDGDLRRLRRPPAL